MSRRIFMAKETKRERQLKLLLNEFEIKRTLKVKDIQALLECQRGTVYNYIKLLENQGFHFEQYTENRIAFYTMVESSPTDMYYNPINKNTIRSYYILSILQDKSLTLTELYNHVYKENQKIDIGKTQLYHLTNDLINGGELTKSLDGKLTPTNKTFPPTFSCSERELWELYYSLEDINPGEPFYELLNSIYQKMSVIFNDCDYNLLSENFISYGRSFHRSQRIQTQLEPLKDIPYETHTIEVTFESKKYGVITVPINIGDIVFSIEKDRLYLIGEYDQTPYTIAADTIQQVKLLNEPNKIFRSDKYQQLINYMFSISTDEPQAVVVEFDNIFNIRTKLEQLCRNRKHARLSFVDEKVIYSDTVSGLSDFANYLRQYGKSCRVIEPPELVDKMLFSATRTLERYKEEI